MDAKSRASEKTEKIERQGMNQNDAISDGNEAMRKSNLAVAMKSLASALDKHQIHIMVKKLLEEWKNISSEYQGQFKEAIKQTKKNIGFPAIPGFKAPEKALERCPQILGEPLEQMLHSSPPESPLFAIMIVLWREAHQQLCDSVLRFLKDDDSRPAILNQARKNFPRGWLKTNEWTSVRKDFIGSQDVDFPLDHVDLMLCYVAHIHFSNQGVEVDSLPLNDWANSLKRLPCDDPLWGRRFDFFCQRIKKIGKSKHAEQSVVADLKNTLAEVERKFADDLTFLELKIPSVTRETISPDFDAARKFADQLRKALERYSSLRRELKEAKTYAREQDSQKKQKEAAQRIFDTHSKLEEMLDQQATPTESPAAHFAPPQPERENEQIEAKEKELRQQIQNLQKAAKADNKQIEHLRQQVEKLQEITAANKEEIKKLRASRDTSRESEKLWRETYQHEMKRKSSADADGQKAEGKVRSVQEAFEIAERNYPDELLVKLNNHSNLKKNRFEKPDEVLKALQWLAIFYRKARMDGASTSNLDESLRETCSSNWSYSANQSEFALRESPGWYTTIVNNKRYELEPHIGAGSSRDERHTIRIAFAWVPELKKVVVGFVGQHQRTPKKA